MTDTVKNVISLNDDTTTLYMNIIYYIYITLLHIIIYEPNYSMFASKQYHCNTEIPHDMLDLCLSS